MIRKLGIVMTVVFMVAICTFKVNAEQQTKLNSPKVQDEALEIRQELESLSQQAKQVESELRKIEAQAKPLKKQLLSINNKIKADKEELKDLRQKHKEKR